MGIPKGMKSRKWSAEEKLRIVNRYSDEEIGIKRLAPIRVCPWHANQKRAFTKRKTL